MTSFSPPHHRPHAGKKVAIVQSSYIPWKGYFDLINMVDEFILYDDVQFTRRDWRNRNLIKTAGGLRWLTIPVQVKGKYLQKINETLVSEPNWGHKHWSILHHAYARASFFREYLEIFESLYLDSTEDSLSRINYRFITAICELLGIRTKISWSMDYKLAEGKNERLIGLCVSAGADHYISGPSARSYIDERLFADAGISVSYINYSGYPEYRQLYGPFEHGVSILDLLFNEGPDAPAYMKSSSQMTTVASPHK